MVKKSKKQLVLEKLYLQCKEKNNYVFSNDEVKEIARELSFGNPFDVTKIDNSNKLPELLLQENIFIIHLGKGRHKFVKGIN